MQIKSFKKYFIGITSAIILFGIGITFIYLWKSSNGFNKNLVGFYLKSDDEKLYLYDQNITFDSNKEYCFEIIETLNNNSSYDVNFEIYNDFTFEYESIIYKFSDLAVDLNEIFNLKIDGKKFYFSTYYDINDIISYSFGNNIVIDELALDEYYFKFSVKSNSSYLEFPFNYKIPLVEINLDIPGVIF